MMKLVCSLLLFILSTSAFAQNGKLNVMSFNIRCGSCESAESPNYWKKRKYFVAHLIKTHNPDVIGLQEAELSQIEDLVEMLDDYSWIGVGRDDGKDKGEATAILFRSGRFSLQGQKNLWLSQTPQQVSRGWDATYRRTLTIAQLLDAQTKKALYVFNTHFDNEGEMARQESAKLLLAEMDKLDQQLPVVVTGDFNTKADSKAYEILTEKLMDAEKSSSTPATGGSKTFNGFGEDTEVDNKIDFIFANKLLKVMSHQIDTTTYNNLYPSDHYPLVVQVENSPVLE
jgi:endonuclease/exonuclease/phosphatase family metal-dependent hydrolase